MLIEHYIEALVADEAGADDVWDAWNSGDIHNVTALLAWLILIINAEMNNKNNS